MAGCDIRKGAASLFRAEYALLAAYVLREGWFASTLDNGTGKGEKVR